MRPFQNQVLFLLFWTLFFFPTPTHSAEPSTTRQTLSQEINGILQKHRLLKSDLSLSIVALKKGEAPLYEYNPHHLLNPASNIKILTAAAALNNLGPNFTFKTKFLSENPIRQGRIQNLWVEGQGDPYFVEEELERIVAILKEEGLKEIQGDIILQDSYFVPKTGTTYLSSDEGKVYQVFTGALSLNFNTVRIQAKGGDKPGLPIDLEIDPSTAAYAKVLNRALTISQKGVSTLDADFERLGGDMSLVVEGKQPAQGLSVIQTGVPQPSLYFGYALLQNLGEHGITVKGKIRRGIPKLELTPLAVYQSHPLSKTLRGLGKFSNNFMAEQLLIVMGAVVKGVPGSTRKGLTVAKNYLANLQIPQGSYILENGSGLSQVNRMSSAQILKVLQQLYRHPTYREPFLNSLSIAGVDGTLEKRFLTSPVRERVRAKTGRLNESSCLSGFLETEGDLIAFVFLANNFQQRHPDVEKAYEEILEAVDRYWKEKG